MGDTRREQNHILVVNGVCTDIDVQVNNSSSRFTGLGYGQIKT